VTHEYSVIGGINRARIGQNIGSIAAAVSSLLVALLLAGVHVAELLGFRDEIPEVLMPPIGAGVVFGVLYWLFDRHIWKLPGLSKALGVPDLSGKWRCDGQTINPDKTKGYVWSGEVIVVQSWDRIKVRLKTAQSGSNSITAALIRDEVDGFRLFYSYRNDPHVDESDLQSHRGFADLTFAQNLRSARGEYFNGLGRFTFGIMTLTKEA
jgi:hypothetical protein